MILSLRVLKNGIPLRRSKGLDESLLFHIGIFFKMNILIISKSVDKDRIAGENYNLSVSSYVEAKDTRERFKEGEFMDYILESLKQQNISSGLLDAVADFRRK